MSIFMDFVNTVQETIESISVLVSNCSSNLISLLVAVIGLGVPLLTHIFNSKGSSAIDRRNKLDDFSSDLVSLLHIVMELEEYLRITPGFRFYFYTQEPAIFAESHTAITKLRNDAMYIESAEVKDIAEELCCKIEHMMKSNYLSQEYFDGVSTIKFLSTQLRNAISRYYKSL